MCVCWYFLGLYFPFQVNTSETPVYSKADVILVDGALALSDNDFTECIKRCSHLGYRGSCRTAVIRNTTGANRCKSLRNPPKPYAIGNMVQIHPEYNFATDYVCHVTLPGNSGEDKIKTRTLKENTMVYFTLQPYFNRGNIYIYMYLSSKQSECERV